MEVVKIKIELSSEFAKKYKNTYTIETENLEPMSDFFNKHMHSSYTKETGEFEMLMDDIRAYVEIDNLGDDAFIDWDEWDRIEDEYGVEGERNYSPRRYR